MTVTIKDIAELAGVSFSTVSKALRNSPLVQETTKRKILEIAEQVGYQPNIAARKLVSKKSGAFGVVWPSVERATLSLLMTKINEELEFQGFTTLFSINRMSSAIEAFHRFQVDAILIFDDRDHSLRNQQRFSTNIPILNYGIAGTTAYPTIDVNRRQSIGLAVQHLYELGHRQLAYIGSVPNNDVFQEEKAAAFKSQITSLGISGQVIPISSMDSHDGYAAAKSLLQQADRPSAIISGSYDLSRGILRAASELGIQVPNQLSLISYDHIPQMGSLDIPLTVVGVEVSLIAKQIVKSLILLSDGKEQPPLINLEPELLIRASTSPL